MSGGAGGGGADGPPGAAAGGDGPALVLAHTDGHLWRRYRRRHGGALAAADAVDCDMRQFSPRARDLGRRAWSLLAYNEYRAVATMAQVSHGMTLAQAPLDLTAAACAFPGEELLHAHLCASLAARCGGEPDPGWRPAPLLARPPPAQPARFRAWSDALVVGNLCVAESISFALLKAALAGAAGSFAQPVLKILCRDEALHAELGWAYLDWLAPRLVDEDRAHLAAVARQAVETYRDVWRHTGPAAAATEVDLHALCMLTPRRQEEVGERAVAEAVRAPLATYGITI